MKVASVTRFLLSVAGVASKGIPKSPVPSDTFFDQPWRPSKHIDDHGFLTNVYPRVQGLWEEETPIRRGRYKTSKLEDFPALVRQVPGDGNCLFHAVAVSLSRAEKGRHMTFGDFAEVRQQATTLRHETTKYLRRRMNGELYLTGKDSIATKDLLNRLATNYGLTPQEYCDAMDTDGVWGGGPEIVALCNLLKRPIHLYQLVAVEKKFCLRRWCCFGSPKYDSRNGAIHILSADSRFPDLRPGRQRKKGNHFLAVFPQRRGTTL